MFVDEIMNDFDNISADFFEQKSSDEETLNALEDLLSQCEQSFENYSEKYKNDVKQLEQLMIEISNFEMAIYANLLNSEIEEDNEQEEVDLESYDSYEKDYLEAAKELTKFGYVDGENNPADDMNMIQDASVNFADEEEEQIELEETSLPESDKEEDLQWATDRLTNIQSAKDDLHKSTITIKKAIEDRLSQYNETLSSGDKAKIIAESKWLRRDLPIYNLEINKWAIQFQQYVNELKAQKEAIQEFLANEIDNAAVENYQNPINIQTLTEEKNNAKNAEDQQKIDDLDAKIAELEAKIQEDIEKAQSDLETKEQEEEQLEQEEQVQESEQKAEQEAVANDTESTLNNIVENLTNI